MDVSDIEGYIFKIKTHKFERNLNEKSGKAVSDVQLPSQEAFENIDDDFENFPRNGRKIKPEKANIDDEHINKHDSKVRHC